MVTHEQDNGVHIVLLETYYPKRGIHKARRIKEDNDNGR